MSSPKPFHILVVDDEPDILEFLSYNINKEGFEVYSAQNGKDAIEKAKKVNPHLILLDVMMPEIDGMQFLAIYSSTFEDHKPIIVVSGSYSDREVRDMMQKKSLDEIQKLTDKYIKAIDDQLAVKEKEIMEI